MEEHIKTMLPSLNEKQKRVFLGSITKEYGRGGLKKVCEISGCSAHTVIKGKKELSDGVEAAYAKVAADGRN